MAKKRKDGKRWTTADGRSLLPSEMDDRHLVNTILFINKKVFAAKLLGLLDKGATDEALARILFPVYDDLVAEMKRRLAGDCGEESEAKVKRLFSLEGT